MRKITQKAVNAFYEGSNFKSGNTEVFYNPFSKKVELRLHGNVIAQRPDFDTSKVTISNCGWQSNTTKERLNALRNVSIQQKKGVWYLNNKVWDGKPTTV